MVTHYCCISKQNVNWRRAKKCASFDKNPIHDSNAPRTCTYCYFSTKLDHNPYDVQEDA